MLVDRGYIKYSDKICQYWPKFAQNGKENISLEMIMCHQVLNNKNTCKHNIA